MNILILKSESDSNKYSQIFQENKINTTFISTLDFKFKNLEKLKEKLNNPEEYSGIIFTSPRSVLAVQLACGNDSKDIMRNWIDLKNYCVGETTYNLAKNELNLETKGQNTGNALILSELIKNDFNESKNNNKSFLFPCGNLKLDTLNVKLNESNISMDSIEIYETISHPEFEENLKKYLLNKLNFYDFIIFFSPSGVNNFYDTLEKINCKLTTEKLIAIGPSTKKALESKNFTVYRTCEKPTPESLLKCIVE